MDEYPENYDEYDGVDPDEYEAMLEQEFLNDHDAIPKSSTQTAPPISSSQSQNNGQVSQKSQPENTSVRTSLALTQKKDYSQVLFPDEVVASANKKRTIEDVFGDIDDIIFEEQARKKKRDNKEVELELVAKILELRRRNQSQFSAVQPVKESDINLTYLKYKNDLSNISTTVPRWPYITAKKHNGDFNMNVYLRLHSESYMDDEIASVPVLNNYKAQSNDVMGHKFSSVWDEAQKIVGRYYVGENVNNSHPASVAADEVVQLDNINPVDVVDDSLWVDIYKPKTYIELLSDEFVNRSLLHWIKLWDKVALNKAPFVRKIFKKPENGKESKWKQFQQKKLELDMRVDEDGRPFYKIALLCGPPGLGKTTLAHMVAKQAGYNPLEVNASDDRSVDAFKHALENATQMKSVLDQQNRPNCLILDEIDGAPAATIEYLVKFVNGSLKTGKKGGKKSMVLKRPIICICNDGYTPALRSLRGLALIINFPQTSSARLAERLLKISREQHVSTDISTLLALCDKTQCDVRSCLSVLHFFKAQEKPVRLIDVQNSNIGQKDVQKSLFTVWQDIFQIQRVKSNEAQSSGVVETLPTVARRMNDVLKTVQSFGEYDRLILGVFENYPKISMRDYRLETVSEALEWFCTADLLSHSINSNQNYILLPYVPYCFVVWHILFATLSKPKLVYPNTDFQAFKKSQEIQMIQRDVMNGISPALRTHLQPMTITLDVASYLLQIICPKMKSLNITLLSPEDRAELEHVVNVMIDYNLNYIQERDETGNYKYRLDPSLDQILPGKTKDGIGQQQLSYSAKQLIGQQVELEKLRRIEKALAPLYKSVEQPRDKENETTPMRTQNHLIKLQPKSLVEPDGGKKKIPRDFFGRPLTLSQVAASKNHKKISEKGDIWYHYKEGYNNAVRKNIKIDFFL